jgi:hypothetical protein
MENGSHPHPDILELSGHHGEGTVKCGNQLVDFFAGERQGGQEGRRQKWLCERENPLPAPWAAE